MSKSSSGDLYWVEHRYVMVNIYLKKKDPPSPEYSSHNVCMPWALKKTKLRAFKSAIINEPSL